MRVLTSALGILGHLSDPSSAVSLFTEYEFVHVRKSILLIFNEITIDVLVNKIDTKLKQTDEMYVCYINTETVRQKKTLESYTENFMS